MKKADKGFNISSYYQRLFIGACVLGWLLQAAIILYETVGHSSYASGIIWLYQAAAWGLPILFFLTTLALFRKRYSGQKLLFFGTFLTTIGVLIFDALMTVEQSILSLYMLHRNGPYNSSFWTGPANEWLMMGLGVLVFAVIVFYSLRRTDR